MYIMKKLLITLYVLLSASFILQAQTWNGTVSSNWNDPLNWTPNAVPGSGSSVTINAAPNVPKLQGSTSIGLMNMTGGSFDFNGFSLTVGGLSGINSFNNTTLLNSNVSTDIVLNINTGAASYYSQINGCIVNDKITINLTGVDIFYEGVTANTYNGDVVINVNGTLQVNLCQSTSSQFNGNLNYNRTVAGISNLFVVGGHVTGNFTYQNNVGGTSAFGNATTTSSINGTCTIDVNDPTPSVFSMLRIKNLTTGGAINVQNPLGFNLQNDSLKVTSLAIQGYRGSNYGYLLSNKVDGNVTLADDISYGSGYYTDLRNNLITGNSSFTINGSNYFYESNGTGTGSTYNGNTVYTMNGSGYLYLHQGDKSTYNGNMTINRTASGYTRAFNAGSTINGNYVYNNTASGDADFGSVSNSTYISGTVNMNVNLTSIGGFSMYRMVNQTTGGKINLQNTRGFDIKNDSLKVDSMNVISYRGNGYGYFYNNQLNGQLTLADSTSYTTGYYTNLQNNTVTGNSIFRVYGSNPFYEASALSSPNTFNGNVTIIISGSAPVYTSYQAGSTITGNFTVNRTGAGYTRMFANGTTIGGNFSYTKNASGGSDLGLLSSKTSIGGTVNINVTQTNSDPFSMFRIQNGTNGGSILVQNSQAPNVQQDTLLLASIGFMGYGGSQYANFFNNQITGNLTIQTDPGYGSGYMTYLRNNTVTGNTICTSQSSNTFFEADASGSANTFNGNVTYNGNGSGSLYISHADKSTYNGNLTINRTVGGVTKAFNFGATINGNLSYTKNVPGGSEFGNIGKKTAVSGMINMAVTQTTTDNFQLYWLVNATNGGAINVQNTSAYSIQRDSLLLTSLSVTGYAGSAYAYLYDNQITGNLTSLADATYLGGYSTYIHHNTINGNSIFTILSSNGLNEADAAASANTFNGDVTFNCDGSGALYISYGDKSTYNGNLTINRTVAGFTKAFNVGATINGNLTYTKNAAGSSEFGQGGYKTSISGTINMNVTQTIADNFNMFRIVNGTTGGSINVQDTKAFTIQQDTLKLTSLSINGYSGGGYAYLYDNQIEGDLITSDNASYVGGYATYFRNNTVSGNSNITINGTNAFNDADAGASGNTYLGNVTYSRIGSGVINVASGDTNSYGGNLVFNNAIALPINANLVKFIGSANTNIDQLGTGNIAIQNFILNKTSSAKVILNKPVLVSTLCSFVSGYINSTASNSLIFSDNVNHSGASDNSHVIGVVTKVGNDAFTFPLGNGIGYHPLAITAPAAVTDSFQAGIVLKHPSDDGYNVASKDAALLQIAPYHYWTLNQISGANSETVSLGWSIPCANTVIASLPGMAVARWNGTQWNNLGNSATTGSTSLGTVSMTGTTPTYGIFALATTSAANSWQITSVSASASTVCAGTSTTLTGAGATTYNWQPGNLSGISVIVTPLSTTTYTITGTSATGCITTATKTITVNPLPVVSTSASATTLCAGVSTTITASNANTYIWQPGSLSTNPITVSPAATTTYTVTGTITATGCTNTSTRTITVNPLPAVNTSASATTLCAGASTTITGSNANTYIWQPGSLSTNPITVTPAATTIYTVTGTNTATGCTNTSTRTITVNALPAVNTSASVSTLCAGASTTITASNANTYIWQPGSLSTNPITVIPVATTTYTVTGTNTATGCTNTATRTITVNPLPSVSTSASATTLCAGASTTITAANANTYVWQPGALSTNPITVSPAATTTYTVTGTTTATGCTNTSTRIITVNPLPAVSTSASATTLCAGASSTITAANANTYVWQPGALITNPITVSPAATTTYTVTGTTTATGCTNTSTQTITVNALPVVSTTASATTLCAGSSTTITAANANTYVWQPGALTTNPITVSPAVTTTYTVTGTTTATGCTNTFTRTITVNPLPAVSTTASATTLCAGSSTTITAANANTYIWQPGALTTNPITVSPAATTTYTVTGTNTATGCTNTSTRTITVNTLPSVGTTASATTICNGTSTTLTGTGAATYTWQPGSLTGVSVTVSPASTTTYTVTGTNASGCTNTSTRLITVNSCNTILNLKLFIEAYFKGTGMDAVLLNQGVSLSNTITDSIQVELRNTTAPYSLVASLKTILNTNGTAVCTFAPSVSGTYYVVVKHRNSVQTWSSAGVAVGGAPVTYDFSNLITKAYGNNMKLVSTVPNVYAFYSGDINQDENVDLLDLSLLETDINNFSFGYFATDINGDGNVDLLDSPTLENNINDFIFSNHP